MLCDFSLSSHEYDILKLFETCEILVWLKKLYFCDTAVW